jgi:outer membrane autotransporter protein
VSVPQIGSLSHYGKWLASLLIVTLCSEGTAQAQSIESLLPGGILGGSLSRDNPYGVAGLQPARLEYLNGLRLWSSTVAGHSSLEGDPAMGTQKVVASVVGLSLGGDVQPDSVTLLGASLGLSHQTFSSAGGNGSSQDLTFALYGRRTLFEHAYVTVAMGYGLHHVETRRSVPLFNTILGAAYDAEDIGGRIEGGYSFTFDETRVISPYSAFVGDSYRQPAYSETVISGSPIMSASFGSKSIPVTHAELGLRFGQYFALKDGKSLSLDAVGAWEHELDDNPYVIASFQAFPDSSFAVPGTRPDRETGLLGLGLRLQQDDRLTFGLRGDARLGAGTTIVSGTADLTYRW